MITLHPHMKVFVCVPPIDFRKGIDGIAQVCRELFNEEPMSGAIFVFKSRKSTSVKLLTYDGQGFWLCQKRLSKGRFKWWPEDPVLSAKELAVLLFNGSPDGANFQSEWRKLV